MPAILIPILMPTLGKLAIGLVTIGLSYLSFLIRKKINNDEATKAVEIINQAIITCVTNAQQIVVDELKDTTNFNKDQQQKIKASVIAGVKTMITEQTIISSQAIISDLDNYIGKKIEETVYNLK